jgi:signal transduction histidine kinase
MRLEEVRAIQRQSERLQRLVEDLLDFSTIESGRLNVRLEALDLSEALSAVTASSAVPATVDAPVGVLVMADRRRVEQVLVNLLENAEKYGRPPVTVSAAIESGEAVVTVADAGPGVPIGATANLFTRFYQVDQSATRTGGGVGLGLALVKGYVEAQGGRVWYERGEPGARFQFSLPLASAPAVVEPA